MLESGTTDCAFRERAIDGRRPWVGRATLATEYTVRYLLWVPVYQMYGAKTVAIIEGGGVSCASVHVTERASTDRMPWKAARNARHVITVARFIINAMKRSY